MTQRDVTVELKQLRLHGMAPPRSGLRAPPHPPRAQPASPDRLTTFRFSSILPLMKTPSQPAVPHDPAHIDIAKDAADGLVVATPWFADRDDPKVKAFVAKYEKAYGKKPDQFAAQAYDAFYIMTDALKAAGVSKADVYTDKASGSKSARPCPENLYGKPRTSPNSCRSKFRRPEHMVLPWITQ